MFLLLLWTLLPVKAGNINAIDREKTEIISNALIEDEIGKENHHKRSNMIPRSKMLPKLRHEHSYSSIDSGDLYSQKLKNIVRTLKCHKDCSSFDVDFKKSVKNVSIILKDLNPLDGVRMENNTLHNFVKIWRNVKDEVDSTFYNHVLIKTALSRSDSSGKIQLPSSLETGTSKFLSAPKNKDYALGAQKIDFEENSPLKGLVEEKMDYFREDFNLQTFHDDWHLSNSDRYPLSRARERFAYMHRQMLNRYMIDRQMTGISDINPLDPGELSTTLNSYYANYRFPSYSPTKDLCRLSRESVRQMKSMRDYTLSRIHRGESYESFVGYLEDNYHSFGHIELSDQCKENNRLRGYLWSPEVSARDPLFYRWHLEIENIIKQFDEGKSYRYDDLKPATQVVLDNISLQSSCDKTNVVLNYLHWLPVSIRQNDWVIKTLQTEDFSINFRLRNLNRRRKKVIFRIFLAPEKLYTKREWYIELDRWVYKLSGRRYEDITRKSTESSLTRKNSYAVSCSWPYSLILPKGGPSDGANKFRLVVFVHDVTSFRVNEGENSYEQPSMYCGSTNRYFKPDAREFGFPMDKPWQDVSMQKVLDNQDRYFGNVSTTISIIYYREKPISCPTISPGITTTTRRPEPTTTTFRQTTTKSRHTTHKPHRPSTIWDILSEVGNWVLNNLPSGRNKSTPGRDFHSGETHDRMSIEDLGDWPTYGLRDWPSDGFVTNWKDSLPYQPTSRYRQPSWEKRG